jgi:chemotaxis signal transduction protein
MAELVTLEEDISYDSANRWNGGMFKWRGVDVPLIIYDALVDTDIKDISGSHVAILNTPSDNARCQFVAILVCGIPRLTKLNSKDISIADEEGSDYDKSLVRYQGEVYRIPNLDKLEQKAVTMLA